MKQPSSPREKVFGGATPKYVLLLALFGPTRAPWASSWWTEGDLVRELGVAWKSTSSHLELLERFGILETDLRSRPRRWRLTEHDNLTASQRRLCEGLATLLQALEEFPLEA